MNLFYVKIIDDTLNMLKNWANVIMDVGPNLIIRWIILSHLTYTYFPLINSKTTKL